MIDYVGKLFRLMPNGTLMPFVPPPTIVTSIIEPKKNKLKPLDEWMKMDEHIHKKICESDVGE